MLKWSITEIIRNYYEKNSCYYFVDFNAYRLRRGRHLCFMQSDNEQMFLKVPFDFLHKILKINKKIVYNQLKE